MSCAVDQQAAQEKLDSSEERARELYDCNKRLEDHIHDLESRKRAPLYQKKQVSMWLHRLRTALRRQQTL
jgi:hypothetical protein